ncbi:winged helix-turn-helix transcriptional regulator [Brevibacillus sp. SYP-B805]|uniref:carbohydrate kinase n=1 Tax=Brevibacillus sp. SYP-B805 TaxID=1578199 RepID=UPI0013EAEC7A|nr:carbohydrate kinase [Brevibacillus sp. SYP-B805]NGQ97431.1 winged helix-turn-helix transcriptional regulator [Brevibacillus sp. SYP-B805]
MEPTGKEEQILHYIRLNPFISQQELAEKVGISRSAVAGYIASLTKRGIIKGRAYVLSEEALIVCIGGANLDRKAHSKGKVRLHSSNPVTVTEACGGVARNVAENLGRLGCHVSLITCIGDDSEGRWVLKETQASGVDVSRSLMLPAERTGTYTALLGTDGEMVISLANMDIYDRFVPEMLAERWSFIAGAKAVFLDTNLPPASLSYVIERCRDEGIPLYIDPVSSAKAAKLPERLEGVRALLPNREEAEILARMKIKTLEDCRTACERIRARGAQSVVVTLGARGVCYAAEDGWEHLPPLPVEVVDVTGAGDSFAAGFLYGVMQGEPIPLACRLGLAAASLTLASEHSVSPRMQAERLYEQIKERS